MAAEHMTREYTVYADESATGERYLGFGALIASSGAMARAEGSLKAFCNNNGFADRSVSWKSCSPGETGRYREFVSRFARLNTPRLQLDFRAMIVDTKRHPLKHPASRADTAEQGFYKFYYSFLSRSLKIVATNPCQFKLVVGATTDQYRFRTDILENTVAGKLRSAFGVPLEMTSLERTDPRDSRCHQLADLLLGAVTYRFNRSTRDPEGRSHKRAVHDAVRSLAGRDLDTDCLPAERPFNVWAWAPKGQRRWAPGAGGVVR
ncbi:hypothetical protein [Candidatus Palauibacter sp.]|uniref:hypothetical protein n=1 Tax=Candidatus Palauibacter sp. TaxID=3101350 RepID=UPI003AF2F745